MNNKISLLLSSLLLATIILAAAAAPATAQIEQKQQPGDIIISPSTTVTKFVDDTGVTINYVPPGWTIIDNDNSSPEVAELERNMSTTAQAVTLCPPGTGTEPGLLHGDDFFGAQYDCATEGGGHYGQVSIDYFPAMDQNEDHIVPEATVRDPETGIFNLNITAQHVLGYTISPFFDLIVQNRSVPVNITNPNDGTSWQVPGLLVLIAHPEGLTLKNIGLYFVDHSTGYIITVSGPRGTPEPLRSGETFPTDPRGEPIRIHGIGLDNLPAVLEEPMKIINSISITRR